MRRTRSQSASGGNTPPAAGPSAEVAGRRRASPAAKGKSPATKVETASPLRNARRKGRPKTESKDNSSVETCSAGSCDKNNLEEQTESLDNNDAAEMDWEEGHLEKIEYSDELRETITVEFNDVPSSTNKKSVRRPTAEEKELAELVHKVHLLCLIARGRVIDKACDDTLIQASVLSLVPYHLLWGLSDVPNLKAVNLRSLVSWFHRTFCVTAQSTDRGSFKSNLAFTIQDHVGTAEEVCALSVALFRALNLTARFVTNLDVAGLKPDTKVKGTFSQDASRLCTRALPCSSPFSDDNMITTPALMKDNSQGSVSMNQQRGDLGKLKQDSACKRSLSKTLSVIKSDHESSCASTSKDKSASNQFPSSNDAEVPKRKGDVEFELQLEMALSATAAETQNSKLATHMSQSTVSLQNSSPPLKKMRQNVEAVSSSSAIWSRSAGAPLYWAEVYCGGQASTGRWVHVDVVNDLIDAERKVETSSAVCKKPLRYVVAFAGNGAKDVTRRYCLQWHRIAQGRVNSEWWDNVLAPLKHMELAATNNYEDMELQTRALTEPLPTNQQAYKDHHLYALEKWLHKNQILHPKGPVLGFCKGHPVYPRSCVQTLQSRHGWLREGLQVRENELAAKVVTRPKRTFNAQSVQSSGNEDGLKPTLELYGEWQLEPLQLPHAVNGVVPKNERGQVDVWSEKCLPPGTVHLRDVVHDVAMDYYGKRIATASSDNTIKIVGVSGTSHQQLATLSGHQGPVWQVVWAHPKFGSMLASCGYDGCVIIWKEGGRPDEWVQAHTFTEHKSSVNSIAWAPHELGLCLACGSSDGNISVFTARADGIWDTTRIDQAHPVGVTSVSWAPAMAPGALITAGPSGQFEYVQKLASGGCDNTVKVWKLQNGSWRMDCFPALQMHKDWVRDVAWAPNLGLPKSTIASASQDGTVVIWTEAKEGEQWVGRVLHDFKTPVWRLSWSLTGNILAASDGNNNVTLWKEAVDGEWQQVTTVEP